MRAERTTSSSALQSLIWVFLLLGTACGPDEAAWERHHAAAGEAYRQRSFALAEEHLLAALAEAEAFGPGDPRLAETLNNLAGIQRERGKHAEAEALFTRALTIREKSLGPDHMEVATSLRNLAGLYRARGDHARAQPLFERSLKIREGHPGQELWVAESLNDLAGNYQAQGEFARAEPLFKRSLAIRKKALPADHLALEMSLYNLGGLYLIQGRDAEAQYFFERARGIQGAPGAGPSDVAMNLLALASHYQAQGQHAEAKLVYDRALALQESQLGQDHPQVAVILESYAGLLRSTGRNAEADRLDARARKIRAAKRSGS